MIAVLTSAACATAGGTVVAAQTPVDSGHVVTPPVRDTVPIGFGSMRQDEVSLAIRTGALLVKVTPLNEGIIRLLAPDTYRRLHALAENKRADLSKGIGTRELFMISFFSYQPDVTFQPEDVQITHQGRTLRSRAIAPLTPGWGRQRMQQQENESAIYAFDGPIDFDQDIVLQYGTEQLDVWREILARIQLERSKVKSRSGH